MPPPLRAAPLRRRACGQAALHTCIRRAAREGQAAPQTWSSAAPPPAGRPARASGSRCTAEPRGPAARPHCRGRARLSPTSPLTALLARPCADALAPSTRLARHPAGTAGPPGQATAGPRAPRWPPCPACMTSGGACRAARLKGARGLCAPQLLVHAGGRNGGLGQQVHLRDELAQHRAARQALRRARVLAPGPRAPVSGRRAAVIGWIQGAG